MADNMLYLFIGARPNFMKIAPVCRALDNKCLKYKIFHTGQHYDCNLSTDFIKEFGIKNVINMNCFNENHVKMMQLVLHEANNLFLEDRNKIKYVVVVGDVSSSCTVTIAAKRNNIPVIHIEAGLRSFDISMPEEHNRIVIDSLSDILFTTCDNASMNLANEGIIDHIYMVGNVMIDTLRYIIERNLINVDKKQNKKIVVTFHRPENVDNYEILCKIVSELISLSSQYEIIFPIHPRTSAYLYEFKLLDRLSNYSNIVLHKPMSYIEFMKEIIDSCCVITDSGGIQEETTYLGIPCFTVRKNTERPITISHGTNRLIKYNNIVNSVINIPFQNYSKEKPPLWDGFAAGRIVDIIEDYILERRK